MDLDKVFIADIEAIGFLDKLSKKEDLHVLSCAYKDQEGMWQIKSTRDWDAVQKVVGDENNIIVFHNGMSYDKPALEKMGFVVNAEIIDTLGLSYYLYSELDKHGLAYWGEYFGVPKPEIEDEEWKGIGEERKAIIKYYEGDNYQKDSELLKEFKLLDPEHQKQAYEGIKQKREDHYELMEERCREDVKINTNLWVMMLEYLRELYNNDDAMVMRVIRYMNQKMYMLHLQDKNPLYLDIPLTKKNLAKLEAIIEEKTEELKKVMPEVPVYTTRKKPKNLFKKDETVSAAGARWFALLEKEGLPDDYEEDVKEITSYTEPNPGSPKQMKDFLFSKGWKPKIFKDGANGKVPQLRDDDKNLCDSIYKLIEEVPELEALDGLSVATHRAGYLKSFIEKSDENGYCSAWAHAFTRTLRLKHVAPFVNMPKPKATHGELVRSCIIAPPGYVCIGADLSSIEDKCKQISIFPYDPEYVESMNTKGWDAHLSLGLKAGMFTEDEVQFYKYHKNIGKEDEALYKCPESFQGLSEDQQHEAFESLDKRRASAKTTNYACLPEDNTEILTRRGWVSADSLAYDDEILSYNSDKDYTEFTRIDEIHRYKDAEVFSLSNKWWSMESTKDHRWLVNKRIGGRNTRRIEQMYVETKDINSECNIINTRDYKGGKGITDEYEAEFLGWLLSDGYYKWSKKSTAPSTSNGKKRGIKCSIAQKKYYKDVDHVLNTLQVDYKEYENNSGVPVFEIKGVWMRGFMEDLGIERLDKHEVNWCSHVLRMNKKALNSFFEAFWKADGSSTRSGFVIYQNKGNIADAIELCGNLLGMRSSRSIRSCGKMCDINFNFITHTTGQKLKRDFSRTADVFCLTVPNGNFVIRQNGTITITGNCTYGAGAPKIAESADMPLKEAKKLHKGYWDINWSVKKFSKDRIVKTVKGTNWLRLNKKAGGIKQVKETTWIWNEFSNLWLFLKSDKDRFSACNQNFGVKVFDVWGWLLMKAGIEPSFQAHDEYLWYCKEDNVDNHIEALNKSVVRLNEIFDPPVPIEIDYKVGKSYSEVH